MRTRILALITPVLLAVPLSACGGEDIDLADTAYGDTVCAASHHDKSLGEYLKANQGNHGTVIYAKLWREYNRNGSTGDPELERMPDGTWTIPANAPYSLAKRLDCNVEITIQNGTFVVTNLNGVKVGTNGSKFDENTHIKVTIAKGLEIFYA